jgi:ATP-binding cassette subfamily C protein
MLFAGIAEGFGMSMLLPLLGIAINSPGGADISAQQSKSVLEQMVTGFFDSVGLSPTVSVLFVNYFCVEHSTEGHSRPAGQ